MNVHIAICILGFTIRIVTRIVLQFALLRSKARCFLV